MDIATFVKDYQSGLVGILGFTGVIVTLFVNATLGRRQWRDAIEQDRRTLRTALMEELRFLKLVFEDRLVMIKGVEAGDGPEFNSFVVPTDTMSDAYQRLVDRVGLLTSEQAAKAIHAYLAVRQVPAELRLIEDNPYPDGDSRARHWIRLKRERAPTARQQHEVRIKLIADAIRALEAC